MAEKTKNTEKKTNRRIKATTGAWWKSTVVEEVEETTAEQNSAGNEKKLAKDVPAEEPSLKQDLPDLSDLTAEAVAPAKAVKELPPPTKPKTRRSPRRKKEEVEPVPAVVNTAIESTASLTQVDEMVVAESPQKETPPKPPRKRPGRKKKESAAEEAKSESTSTDVDATAVETVVGADDAGEASEAPPAATKTPRKRAPRGRRKKESQPVEPVAETADDVSPETILETGGASESKPVQDVEKAATTETESVEINVKPESADAGAVESAEVPERRKRRSGPRKPRGRRKERGPEAVDGESADAGEQATHEVEQEQQDVKPATADQTLQKIEELPEGDDSDKESIVLKLLINAEEPEECRLALLENGRLESIHVSTINRTLTKNNIYKARIVAIEPNLQAAFVDYGTEKNGFLPFSEIHPEYYKQELSDEIQALVEAHHWKKLSISDVVEKGQDVMVQVVKEEVGKKGANMTTYLSLPGRSVVLMPGSDSSGISRKISGEERRSQLRTAMNSLGIPEGIGWIVRTASADITKTALARDVGYLLRLWEEIKKKAQGMDGVGQVYEDHQSVLRFLREHFDPAIEEILVDDLEAMDQVREFISYLPSKQRDVKVRLHKGSRPIFNQFSVEDQIESIYQPKVNLPSGGSIVIDPTEALVAIDVNSGSTSKGKNFDQSIYQANMEAASEIGRQLRLRDLGGLIVVDFIDMRNKKHIRDVERQLKVSMKRDKAKVDFSRISKFGLMQISRQKLGSPIEAGNYRVCQHCKGRGTVRSVETLALFYLRRIQTGASRKHVQRVECEFPIDVAGYLLNNKRHEIHEHETRYNTEIIINANPVMTPVEHEILLLKAEKEGNGKKQG